MELGKWLVETLFNLPMEKIISQRFIVVCLTTRKAIKKFEDNFFLQFLMSQPRASQRYLVRQSLSKWTRKSTHFLQAYSNYCTAGGKERNTSGLGAVRDRQKEEMETEMEFREESHGDRKVGLVG